MSENKSIQCPSCKQNNNPSHAQCWKCGAKIQEQGLIPPLTRKESATERAISNFFKQEILNLPAWLFAIPTLMLLFSPIFEWPYGYYQLLRVVVFLSAGLVAYWSFRDKQKNWSAVFILLGILFNPFIKIRLEPEVWKTIDVIVGLLWCVFLKRKGISRRIITILIAIPGAIAITLLTGWIVSEVSREWERGRSAERYKEKLREQSQLIRLSDLSGNENDKRDKAESTTTSIEKSTETHNEVPDDLVELVLEHVDSNVRVNFLNAKFVDIKQSFPIGTSVKKSLAFVFQVDVITKTKLLHQPSGDVRISDNFGNFLDGVSNDCTSQVIHDNQNFGVPSRSLRFGDSLKKAFCTDELPLEGSSFFKLEWTDHIFENKESKYSFESQVDFVIPANKIEK